MPNRVPLGMPSFFSVQTLASIGYGAMYPQTIYANVVVTIEALVGLLGFCHRYGSGLCPIFAIDGSSALQSVCGRFPLQ